MTALEVGLVVAVALLAVVAAAQGRALRAAARRLELVERRVGRKERRRDDRADGAAAPVPVVPDTAPVGIAAPLGHLPDDDAEGDAVDVRGEDPAGKPTVVPLTDNEQPTLLAFLSTSCGICIGLWERLLAGDLRDQAQGVAPVVVTKDARLEDVVRIRQLSSASLQVVLSSEAWDDYEVPGSPYVMIVSAAPGTVATEGHVATWDEVVLMARSVTEADSTSR